MTPALGARRVEMQPQLLDADLERPIRILYWNIWYRADPEAVLVALQRYDCDILCLSELTRLTPTSGAVLDTQELFGSALGMSSIVCDTRVLSTRKGEIIESLGIFSKFGLRGAKYKEISKGGRAPFKGGHASRRCYIEVQIGWATHSSLSIGTTHLSYMQRPMLNRKTWLTERQELLSLLRTYPKRNLQFVFGGDLNILPDNTFLRSIEDCNLQELGPMADVASWVGPARLRRLTQPRRLDYAFASSALVRRGVQAQLGNAYPSDHRPLIVSIDRRV